MAEKTGFILYYEMLENLKTLGNDIVVEVLSALSKYDQGLEIGNLSPQAQFAFNTYIPAMKKSKQRWETSVANGKLHKPKSNLHEPSHNLHEPNSNQKEPNDNLHECVNGNVTVNVNENGDDNGEKQPPLFLIKTQIRQHGFFIDDDKLLKHLIAETDPPWLEGRYSFIDFIAKKVQTEYGDKPDGERHKIFRKLLFDAPNLREAYPGWQQEQEKRDALEAARENHPTTCGNCEAKLQLYNGFYLCSSCGIKYTFNQESREWDYHGPPLEGSFSEKLKNISRLKQEEEV